MNPATYSLDSMLIEGAEMLGVGLDESQRARLLAYLKYFIQWNSIYNLSAIRDTQRCRSEENGFSDPFKNGFASSECSGFSKPRRVAAFFRWRAHRCAGKI